MDSYYSLIHQASILTDQEERNWNNYLKFVRDFKREKQKIREQIIDNINSFSYLKRQLEKKIELEVQELERIEESFNFGVLINEIDK